MARRALSAPAQSQQSGVVRVHPRRRFLNGLPFRGDFLVKGHTFRVGDTYNLDATLTRSGDSGLIDAL